MSHRCYLLLAVVAASLLSMTAGCPEATGWYLSKVTGLCYRGLNAERLTYADAQKRCNQLRSNLFQFRRGDSKQDFDALQDDLYDFHRTGEFREASWIGLTDRARVNQFVYLNGFPLNDIAPDTLISCPDAVPSCKPANRCVYLNLDRRGTDNKQVFSGNCGSQMAAICYAPVNGTDQFDSVPALGADSVAGSGALLLLAACLSVVAKSLLLH